MTHGSVGRSATSPPRVPKRSRNGTPVYQSIDSTGKGVPRLAVEQPVQLLRSDQALDDSNLELESSRPCHARRLSRHSHTVNTPQYAHQTGGSRLSSAVPRLSGRRVGRDRSAPTYHAKMSTSSVVVVACKRHPWLASCLESVLNQADEVIVVDNGSPGEWVSAEARRLEARVVRLDRNIGLPGGVNAGLKAAKGDVIGLLNDDALAGETWLSQASAALSDLTIAAVAPKLLLAHPHAEVELPDAVWRAPGDQRPLGRALYRATVAGNDVLAALVGIGIHELEEGNNHGHARWRWTSGLNPFYVPLPSGAKPADIRLNNEPVETHRVVDIINSAGTYLSREGHAGDYGFGTPDHAHFNVPSERFAACGAAFVARSDTFRRIGPFAASFFAYYEDVDWCWRAQLAGLRVVYRPRAVVRHVRGVSSGGDFDARVRFLAARNRLHCQARNAPLDLLHRQMHRLLERGQQPRLVRASAAAVARGLAQRVPLARHWARTPREVFDQWAGIGESWPQAPDSCLKDYQGPPSADLL